MKEESQKLSAECFLSANKKADEDWRQGENLEFDRNDFEEHNFGQLFLARIGRISDEQCLW